MKEDDKNLVRMLAKEENDKFMVPKLDLSHWVSAFCLWTSMISEKMTTGVIKS